MAFDVIPAIDVYGGRIARFRPSGPEEVVDHGGDPERAARAFADAGVTWLHVVDLDLAFDGTHGNLDILRTIVALGVPVQAAGAVATLEELDEALSAGAARVVLGSGALTEVDVVEEAVGRVGDRLVVGIEVEDGRIRARGRHVTDLPLSETIRTVISVGATRMLVTAVSRVGTLAGPDLEAIELVASMGVPVLAAGGIATLPDLRSVRDAGAEGAIVGRAALEGGFDLAGAIASFA